MAIIKSMFPLKKTAWIAGGVLAFTVLVLVGISVYLSSGGFRGQLVDRINREIAGHIQVEEHTISLPAGQLMLSGVTLSDAEGRPVAEIGRLRLRLFWPALLRRTVDVSSLVIEQARLNLIVDAHNRLNLAEALSTTTPPEAREASESGAPWNVKADDVRLHGGLVVFERQADGWSGRIEGLEASGGGDLGRRSGRISLAAATMHVRGPDMQETLRDWALEAHYTPHAREEVSVALRVEQSHLKVRGSVDQSDGELLLALNADLDFAPAQLRPWLPPAIDLGGRLTGNIGLQGALTDPSIRVRLHLGGASVQDVPIDEAVLVARLEKRQVDVEAIQIRSSAGELDLSGAIDLRPVFPASFQHQAAGIDAALYTLDMEGRRIAPGQIPIIDFPWGGVWQAKVRMQGSGLSSETAQGTGTVDFKAGNVKVVPDGRAADAAFAARIDWAEQTVVIQQGQAALGRHRLQADGQYQWAGGRFQAGALLQSPQLAELGALLGAQLPEGQATLRLDGHGSMERPVVRVILAGQELAMSSWRFGRVLIEADLAKDGDLHFERVVVENNGSFIEGRGRMQLLGPDGTMREDPGLALSFNLDPFELSDFLDEPIGGDVLLSGKLDVGGSVRRPTADLKVASSPVRWGDVGGRIEGRVLWKNGSLNVPGLQLVNGASVVSLQGTLLWQDPQTGQWRSDPRLQAELKSDHFDLEDWIDGIAGVLSIDAAAQGSFSDLKGTFQVAAGELDTGVQTFSSMDLEGRLDGATLHADRFVASLSPGQTIEGRGWFNFDQRFEAHLAGKGIELRRIEALQTDPPASGLVTLDLSASGSLKDPLLNARVHVGDPRIGDQQWDDFHLNLEMRERRVAVNADLNFQLTANYAMDSGDFDISGDFNHTDMGPYLALLAGNEWSGRLSGSIRAAGNRRALEAVEARIVLNRTELTFQQVTLLRLDHLEAGLRDGIVTLPPSRFEFVQRGELVVQAEGHFERNLNLKAEGDLPLVALAPFIDSMIDATGSIRIAASAKGPLSQLKWRAEAILVRIGFLWEEWDQAVHDVNGTLRFDPEMVVLENLTGMVENGRFTLDGRLQLKDRQPTEGQLNFKAHSLPVQVPGTLDVVLGADLVLKGDPRRSVLDGRITLLEGAYFKDVDFNIVSSITERRRPVPPRRTWTPPQWLAAIALNIAIDYRHPLLVENNVARLQVAPDLNIGGTVANPVVSGRAGVIEGELLFRRRAFNVTRGVVDFIDPYRIVPHFDIMAQAQIRRWEVTLTAVGTPENLAIEMSSNPPESDSNILSLIVLGRIPGESGRGATTATTEQMLATLIESAWGEQIKERAGVDILEVETGAATETDDAERIRVTVGKQLSPRFTIKYSVEATGGETIQRATSEYRFFEHLLASGFQDTAGIYGGELLFRFNFR